MSSFDDDWLKLHGYPAPSLFYDKNGTPITMERWSELVRDFDYRVVARDEFPAYDVSTVWLGLDHSFFGGPPLIFETMVFSHDEDGQWRGGDMHRYATLEAALAGHDKIVEALRNGQPKELDDGDHQTADTGGELGGPAGGPDNGRQAQRDEEG